MASLSKLIKKFNKAKAAINSYKGVLSKLKSLNYEGILSSDQLKDQYNKARDQLKERKSSLQNALDATNTGSAFAKRRPSEAHSWIFPKSEPCNNWIAFTTRPRNATGEAGENDEGRVDIQLYLPDGAITSAASVTYEGRDMGTKARQMAKLFNGQAGALESLNVVVKETVAETMNEMTGGISNFVYGRAKNPMKEQTLSGMEFRTHEFEFELWPKNAEEAIAIKDITRAFRRAMLPGTFSSGDTAIFDSNGNFDKSDKTGKTENYFSYPDLFDIEFRGPIARQVEGFLPSVMTSCKIDNSSQMYREGYPIFTKISLSFQEVMLMTKQNWVNYVDPSRPDLDATGTDPILTVRGNG